MSGAEEEEDEEPVGGGTEDLIFSFFNIERLRREFWVLCVDIIVFLNNLTSATETFGPMTLRDRQVYCSKISKLYV